MSIHPNRVLARIVEQVEHSDWPPLTAEVHYLAGGEERISLFDEPVQERYATPFHFWVHALRDDLAARDRVADLVHVAGYALCQAQSLDDWQRELDEVWPVGEAPIRCEAIYRMQADECRRSSVALLGDRLVAHFWGHGFETSWRRRGSRQ
jgi:hypothetical protein